MANITIPPAALEAGARAIKEWLTYTLDKDTRASELTDGEHAELARAAFLAMLEAWEGMSRRPTNSPIAGYIEILILPLPQEASNVDG